MRQITVCPRIGCARSSSRTAAVVLSMYHQRRRKRSRLQLGKRSADCGRLRLLVDEANTGLDCCRVSLKEKTTCGIPRAAEGGRSLDTERVSGRFCSN